MNILVEIPHTGHFPWEFVHAFPLMLFTAHQQGISIQYELVGHSLIYEAREAAARKVLTNKEYDAVLFLDSDMMPPADLIPKLVAHNKPIVSALAFKRTEPYYPCIFSKIGPKEATVYLDYPRGLIPVEACGMACCLIKREVFEQIPQPWYFPTPDLGEDLAFCLRAKEAGIPIYADTSVIVGHVGTNVVGEKNYADWV